MVYGGGDHFFFFNLLFRQDGESNFGKKKWNRVNVLTFHTSYLLELTYIDTNFPRLPSGQTRPAPPRSANAPAPSRPRGPSAPARRHHRRSPSPKARPTRRTRVAAAAAFLGRSPRPRWAPSCRRCWARGGGCQWPLALPLALGSRPRRAAAPDSGTVRPIRGGTTSTRPARSARRGPCRRCPCPTLMKLRRWKWRARMGRRSRLFSELILGRVLLASFV